MSIEAEDDTGITIEDQNKEIITLLKAQVFLLEIIASVETGETIEMFEE